MIGATARILDDREPVLTQVDQLPQWDRGRVDIGHLGRSVDRLGTALCQIGEESRQRHLGFVEHEMINARKRGVLVRKQWATRNHFGARRLAAPDQRSRGGGLDIHGADEDIIRPFEILVGKLI